MHVSGTASNLSRDNDLTARAAFTGKCTMYFRSGMGSMVAMKLNRVEVKSGPYAQYSNALFITWREKGKRLDRGVVQTSFPSVLIVEGHDAPEPDGMWDESTRTEGEGASTVRGRYRSCDPRWQSDFDAKVAAAVDAGSLKIIFDGRKNNPYEGTMR